MIFWNVVTKEGVNINKVDMTCTKTPPVLRIRANGTGPVVGARDCSERGRGDPTAYSASTWLHEDYLCKLRVAALTSPLQTFAGLVLLLPRSHFLFALLL